MNFKYFKKFSSNIYQILLYLICACVILPLLSGCSEESLVNTEPVRRNLVIISDDDASSDIIVGILGYVRAKNPEYSVSFFKSKNFDLYEAGYLLDVAVDNFPEGTCFAGIVEPGAGTRKIVFEVQGKKFLMPDNGLGTRIFRRLKPANYYYCENPSLIGGDFDKISYLSFYKYTISSLLNTPNLSDFGKKAAQPVELDIQNPSVSSDTIMGEVLFTDNFGNCVTNIEPSHLSGYKKGDLLRITSGDKSFILKFGSTYSSVEAGENTAFINTSLRLELAVCFSSISERYGLAAGSKITVTKGTIKAGILQYNHSSTADSIVSNMISKMNNSGLVEGKNTVFIRRNANGNLQELPKLLQEILNEKADIIIPVSTPASQAAVKYTPETIPVVFTYVTDPSSAGLLGKRKNVTGVSDVTNFDDFLKFVRRLLPNASIAGRIYNNNESNSAFAQSQLEALGSFYGFSYINATVSSTGEIPAAYQSIKSRNINCIMVVADNTLSQGMTILSGLAAGDLIPLIGDSYEHAMDGALASVSVNYKDLAAGTGTIVKNVLLGKNPDEILISKFPTNIICLNKKTAIQIGFRFSDDILKDAAYIFE